MPTGYTHKIADGQSFEDFVWGCARGFGALIMMRDLPADAEIPERFEPSTWNREKAEELEKKLAELEGLTFEEAETRANEEFEKEWDAHRERLYRDTELKRKYQEMLEKVSAWQEPTVDHEKLKDFMVQQLKESMEFDCGVDHLRPPTRKGPKDWLHHQTSEVNRMLAYHRHEQKLEEERTENRNAWVAALRESLK